MRTRNSIYRSPNSLLMGLAKIGGLLGLFKLLSLLSLLNKGAFERQVMSTLLGRSPAPTYINKSVMGTTDGTESLIDERSYQPLRFDEVFNFENFSRLLTDCEALKR